MITIEDICKSYGTLVAVDGLSLSIRKGEVFGLLGPNGAGKSTTIGMMIGLIAPDRGTVAIEGAGPPMHPAARAMIGVAPQSLALYDEFTADENLRFFGRLFGLAGRALKDRVGAVLDAVGLEARRADRVGGYSGGMKRRLNLAVAMIHDPPILLLDEPTAGVDPQSRNSILGQVRAFAAQGKTVVYTTHYMEEAQRLCDRVGIIDKGRLLTLGTIAELIARFGGESLVTVVRGVGDDAPRETFRTADPSGELRRVLAADGQISSVHVDRPDLEGVFLSLTGRRLRD